MGVSVAISFVGLNCPMRTLIDPVGEGVIDEASFEDRLDDCAERVVNDTVTERRR